MRRSLQWALLAAGVVAFTPTAPIQAQINFSTFVGSTNFAGRAPIGFAYAGNKFVGSFYFGADNNRLFSVGLDGSNFQYFGPTIPVAYGEGYVSSSLGLGGFGSRDIYVGYQDVGTVFMLPNNGSSVSTFVTGLNGGVRSIAFDPYGLYGYDMIVATSTGYIYRINKDGVASVLAQVGEDAEGISFTPQQTGTMEKGTLVVASEGSGNIRSIKPDGTKAVIATVSGAEMVSFVPLNLNSSIDNVYGYYAADYPYQIIKAPASDFAGLLGQMIVTGEYTHDVWAVSFDANGTASYKYLNDFPNQPEDGIFVTPDVVNPTPTVAPEPASLALMVPGLFAVGYVARRRKR